MSSINPDMFEEFRCHIQTAYSIICYDKKEKRICRAFVSFFFYWIAIFPVVICTRLSIDGHAGSKTKLQTFVKSNNSNQELSDLYFLLHIGNETSFFSNYFFSRAA